MSDVATNYFYKLGMYAALAKIGASLETPEDQTYQVHREINSPTTNAEDDVTATQSLWNEHDRHVQTNTVPEYDSRIGV